MQPDPEIPPLTASGPSPLGTPPIPPPPGLIRQSASGRELFATLLSLCFVLFLADAVVSLVDDSLIVLFGLHALSVVRGLVSGLSFLMVIGIYVLVGLTPVVPKRWFLPLPLYIFAAQLLLIPFSIYFYSRLHWVVWAISFGQVILALGILFWVRRGLILRWPLVPADQLGARLFSLRAFCVFLLANIFVLLPVVIAYCVFCATLAVSHFTDGFMALRPEGFTVQVRKYVRDDGKIIELVPMSHIGEPEFYHALSESFPTNATILREGVSDRHHLLTNGISYERMAKSLGVSEQQKEFKPQAKMVMADVDVEQFSTNTIDFLNLVMLIHSKGVNNGTIQMLMRYSQPGDQVQLMDDLLAKRNQHLLAELKTRLADSPYLIVPWGVAHMPGIAKEIEKAGFHMDGTREFVAIRFHSVGGKHKTAAKE